LSKAAVLLGEDFLKLSQYRRYCSARHKRNGDIAEYGKAHLKIKQNANKLNISGAQFEILWAWISGLLALSAILSHPATHILIA